MDALMLMGEGTRIPLKPFIKVSDKPLFLYGWETLTKIFDSVLISCTPAVEKKLKDFNIPYVIDEMMLGPLGGMLAGFKVLSSDYVFVVGCDMPLIKKDVTLHLMRELSSDGLVLSHEDGFVEPLHAFYAREKSVRVLEEILPKKRRVVELIANLNVVKHPSKELRSLDSELTFLRNINTREDLEWLRRRLL